MMILSGGLANHVAMIMRDTKSSAVYVIDCFYDSWGDGKINGVKKTLVNEWLQTAEDGGFEVAYLPLDPKLFRDQANISKLEAWFDKVEGSSYDYAMELFAAIDDAHAGFPAPFNAEIVPILMRLN